MKIYKALVSFGDGRPVETTIEAKNGLDAQEVGFKSHPGARAIRITGVISEVIEPKPKKEHPLFTDYPDAVLIPNPNKYKTSFRDPLPLKLTSSGKRTPLRNKDLLIANAIKLRKGGMSYLQIATRIEVGKTTIRKWMFDAKVP